MRPIHSGLGPRLGDYAPKACDRLAEIHEGGQAPPKDPERARYYAELACQNPGSERDHAPCVRLARYWATGVIKSECVSNEATVCETPMEEAASRIFGPDGSPVLSNECSRPSVKALCEAYRREFKAAKR